MKTFGLYDQFPRRYGKSRKIVYSKKEFLSLANRDNGYMDVFISIYAYSHLKEVKGEFKIDSESAIMDKLFIDMDFKDYIDYKVFYESHPNFANLDEKTKENLLKEYESTRMEKAEKDLFIKVLILEKVLDKRDLLRVWAFSGGGFHLYLFIVNRPENKKYFYRNAVDYLSKIIMKKEEKYIDIEGRERIRKLFDPHCPPKLSQMARVIGTYNPRRKSFCISLKKQDFHDLKDIKELSKYQIPNINYLGTKLMKFSDSYDVADVLEKCSVVLDADIDNYSSDIKELLESLGILMDEIPLCIKPFLKENLKLNYTERYILITFLYRCGLSENEIKEVLKIVLDREKLYHCCGIVKNGFRPSNIQKARIETQIPDIIESDYYLSCTQIRSYGLCNPLCKIKDVLFYFS